MRALTQPRSPAVELPEIITTISTAHFIVVEVLYAPGLTAQIRGGETALLIFTVSGEFVDLSGGRRSGDDSTVLLVGIDEQCELEFRQETRCVLVTTRAQAAPSEIASLAAGGRYLRRSALRPLLRAVWSEARRNDPSARLALDGAIFTLLGELLRIGARAPLRSQLIRSLRLLHGPAGETLSMGELARLSGMSVHSFARAFKEETGATFAVYRRRLRVERAKELLRKTPKPIREICLELGFSQQGYFTRVFARYAGMSPTDYRRVYADTR